MLEQLEIPLVLDLPKGFLPCSRPELVEGYISIERILAGDSTDFSECYICNKVWCEHALNDKRADDSYKILVEHFRNGGQINVPIYRMKEWGDVETTVQSNGHHRVIAAMDAGFTHVPYQTGRSSYTWHDDWSGTPDLAGGTLQY